jgi:MoaA/NifB/PqqE/SkfB family radical SAM enzyme
MAEALRDEGISVWLLTSGLALAKNAEAVSVACDSVTVSLDGTNPATYRAIRGVNAFEKVCEGVRAVVTKGADVTLRVTLQRANFRQLPEFVSLARELGVRSVSFLAVDVSNPHAFARTTVDAAGLALAADDLPHLARLIDSLERDRAADFSAGFIAESPSKLRHIHHYFAAVLGLGEFPAVRCNAPEFSAVVAADGRVAPCFFIPGPGMTTHGGFVAALEHPDMSALRATIRTGKRAECTRCVCSMWRDLARPGFDDLRLQQRCVA